MKTRWSLGGVLFMLNGHSHALQIVQSFSPAYKSSTQRAKNNRSSSHTNVRNDRMYEKKNGNTVSLIRLQVATSETENESLINNGAEKNIDKKILSELNTCTSGSRARQILNQALFKSSQSNNDDDKLLYNSISIPAQASSKFLSDADLAIQTKIRNKEKSVLELIETNGDADADRASLFLFGLMIASPITGIQIQQYSNQMIFVPDIIRFLLVWIFAFLPLIFVGTGLAVPDKLQRQLMIFQGYLFPSFQKRMIQHEAGHLLMGHLLGLPIKNYQVSSNAIQTAVEFYPLADENVGQTRAQTLGFDRRRNTDDLDENSRQTIVVDRPFFSEGGQGDKILQNSVFTDGSDDYDGDDNEIKKYAKKVKKSLVLPKDDPTSVWPYRKLDEATLDMLSVVSLAGVVAEIIGFGNAQGGYADLSQLNSFLKSNDCTDEEIENKIRYAIAFNFSQLRRHLGVLDEVAVAMETGSSVADCVYIIESCQNRMGKGSVMETYEDARKKNLEQNWNILEKTFLGRKSTNGERMDVIEGKGGGDRKEKFVLTGDDPFYAAGALALAFFVWASSGGLTLH